MSQKSLPVKKSNKTIFIAPQFIFTKIHKNLIKGQTHKKYLTDLGANPMGIKALEVAKVTPKQNESFRRTLSKKFKKITISINHSLIPN
jgi:hypothetical protein